MLKEKVLKSGNQQIRSILYFSVYSTQVDIDFCAFGYSFSEYLTIVHRSGGEDRSFMRVSLIIVSRMSEIETRVSRLRLLCFLEGGIKCHAMSI